MTTGQIFINIAVVVAVTMLSRTIFLRGYLYGRSEEAGDLDEKLRVSIRNRSVMSYIVIIICVVAVQL